MPPRSEAAFQLEKRIGKNAKYVATKPLSVGVGSSGWGGGKGADIRIECKKNDLVPTSCGGLCRHATATSTQPERDELGEPPAGTEAKRGVIAGQATGEVPASAQEFQGDELMQQTSRSNGCASDSTRSHFSTVRPVAARMALRNASFATHVARNKVDDLGGGVLDDEGENADAGGRPAVV